MRGPALSLVAVVLASCAAPAPPVAQAPRGPATFNRDVAPIVFERCVSCHRPAQAAPFSLLTYEDARQHARQIAQATATRFMPPWLPEPQEDPACAFRGDRRLTAQQIETLASWASNGAPEGAASDLPLVPEFSAGWQIGEPDLVVQIEKPFEVPAAGRDVFRNFVLPVPVEATRYVRAIELIPTVWKVVHHATLRVDRSRECRRLDDQDPLPGWDGMIWGDAEWPDGHFIGWTPGRVPLRDDGSPPWRLKPGTDLVLQLHLVPDGRPEAVSVKVGLYFTDKAPVRDAAVLRLGSLVIDIPAGSSDYAIADRYVMPVDADLLGLYPHAHYLGRTIEARATLPDGSARTLVRIERWDFNWQDEYRYATPVALPKGTVLDLRIAYDNSAKNLANPHDPPVRVKYGFHTDDEMGDLVLQLLPRNGSDLAALQRDIAAKDALLEIAYYEDKVRETPGDGDARTTLGLRYLVTGRTEEGLRELRRAVQDAPGSARAQLNMGAALQAQGDVDGAIAHLRLAIGSKPDYAEAHFDLASALAAQGKLDEAAASFRAAIDANPSLARSHFGYGVFLRARNDLAGAMTEYREALRLDPTLAEAAYNLGNALASTSDLAGALAAFQQAVDARPDFAQAHQNLGTALAQSGRRDEALAQFREAARLAPGWDAPQQSLARYSVR
ncbi:MAG: tetratricopeptide repeat protein [Acidobacteriota bacterium]